MPPPLPLLVRQEKLAPSDFAPADEPQTPGLPCFPSGEVLPEPVAAFGESAWSCTSVQSTQEKLSVGYCSASARLFVRASSSSWGGHAHVTA